MNESGIISIAIQLIGLVINCLMLKLAIDNRRIETGDKKDQKEITSKHKSSSVHDPPKKTPKNPHGSTRKSPQKRKKGRHPGKR